MASAATFVYVISGDHGRQKIGVSDNPQKRIRELQTGSPFKLKFEFVGQTDGTGFDIEGEAHFMLDRHKENGEWFVVPPDVAITAVMAAASRLGHTITPVDPQRIKPSTVTINGPMPTWSSWLAWSLCMIVFFTVIALTDHFLTAIIAALVSLIIVKPVVRGVVAITGDAVS